MMLPRLGLLRRGTPPASERARSPVGLLPWALLLPLAGSALSDAVVSPATSRPPSLLSTPAEFAGRFCFSPESPESENLPLPAPASCPCQGSGTTGVEDVFGTIKPDGVTSAEAFGPANAAAAGAVRLPLRSIRSHPARLRSPMTRANSTVPIFPWRKRSLASRALPESSSIGSESTATLSSVAHNGVATKQTRTREARQTLTLAANVHAQLL